MNAASAVTELEKRQRDAEAAGVGEYLWLYGRDALRALSVREKLKPSHWQKKLFMFFEDECSYRNQPVNEPLIRAAITTMMEGSRPWCNPTLGLDEAAALKALRTACDTIFAGQDSTDTDGQSEDDGQLSAVDMQDKTAQLVAELGL